ncbi:hypothetical protein IHV25_09435 [Phaeovibrio sulfidiphilus]|uniref:Uncharacterized protein n=1 Tax=Phaeovibrio sulfidiphilus TaxID=1220600 RepID=A0A8J6YNM1_9PROT|nr:hypothetical protein [Phaeovibrio sulfidiphilus]MBE1237865.1 hypothetical protein [Phaeovibrio sulfidiphilus]
MSTISLYREKTTFYKISTASLRRLEDKTSYLRSNRIILDMKPFRDRVVIRANSVHNTLRCAHMILEQFSENSAALSESAEIDWSSLWQTRLSSYDREWNPSAWCSVHVNGRHLFASRKSELIDQIEKVARGADLSEEIIREAVKPYSRPGEDLFVEHESQTAVLFSMFPTSVRATVLERERGRTRSFSVTMPYKEDLLPLFGTRMRFVADVVEAIALREMLEGAGIAYVGSVPAEQLHCARERRIECLQDIIEFEQASSVVYRPERPI